MNAVRTPTLALSTVAPGTEVCVSGRIVVQTERGALLRDASGIARLTVDASSFALHALVTARGTWSGDTIEVESFEVVQASLAEPRELSELARRDNLKQNRLHARARIVRLVRSFFEEQAFLEVETPLLVPSPGLDLHLAAFEVKTGMAAPRYLITSPEYQMKRLLAGGLERIFQVTKCFREEEIGERHQPEFTMVEWYRAFAGAESMMQDTEALVASVATALSGKPVLPTAWGPVDVEPPWPRMTVREAFGRFAGVDLASVVHDEARFFRIMVEQVEPALAEFGALFLCDFPASMASLARTKPDDPSVAERFEAYVAGIELCNGFGELTDAAEQRRRLTADQHAREARGLPVYPLDERFLRALEEGIPPSGGNALGLDRLIMLALGASHIEDVIAVPASRL